MKYSISILITLLLLGSKIDTFSFANSECNDYSVFSNFPKQESKFELSRFPLPIPYRKGQLWGFCISRTTFITPIIYDSLRYFRDYLAAVKLEGKWGIIDTTGKYIIPPNYPHISDAINGIFLSTNSNYSIIFNYKGDSLSCLKGKYDYIAMEYLYKNILPVKKDNKWGFINIKTGY